jgi:NAD(P)-dependent dehydrogenase (short-subunit alcohol dehydrogenase family)
LPELPRAAGFTVVVNYAASAAPAQALAEELGHDSFAVPAGITDEHAVAEDQIERLRPMIPMQRVGAVREVAAAVVWLAGDAPEYLTGSFIDVTGGR